MRSAINTEVLMSESFNNTKRGIQDLCKILVEIKSKLQPGNKNFEEHSLQIGVSGLSTSPIPLFENGRLRFINFDVDFNLDLLKIDLDDEHRVIRLGNRTLNSILVEFKSISNQLSLPWKESSHFDKMDNEIFISSNNTKLLWSVLKSVYVKLMRFKSSILKETSNINFWPHHFDLAMLLFSGKIIKGENPNNWNYSREQMNFGFLFGDDYINKPYFYVTLYPFNEGLLNLGLPESAYWYSKEWNGAVLELEESLLAKTNDEIIDFFGHLRNIAPEQFYK